jgi:ABC-2 type transport system ATP-binding protein
VQSITTVVHKPSLMILDEPFSGFDPVNAELIRTEILRLRDEGATIILSTHNMESVEELCDEITLINRSRVVISGGVDEIRHRYGNNHIELIYTGSTPVRAEEGVFTVLSDEDNAGRHTAVLAVDPAAVGAAGSAAGATGTVLRSLLEQGLAVNSFRELIPRMNDIFIKLVTEGA